MAGNSGLLKRIAQLEKTIRFERARFIVIEIDGRQEEDKEAQAALLAELAVTPSDLVVAIRRFGSVEGLPKVHSVAPL